MVVGRAVDELVDGPAACFFFADFELELMSCLALIWVGVHEGLAAGGDASEFQMMQSKCAPALEWREFATRSRLPDWVICLAAASDPNNHFAEHHPDC